MDYVRRICTLINWLKLQELVNQKAVIMSLCGSHSFQTYCILLSLQCVKLSKFETERSISFIPPDGEFELMRYVCIELCMCLVNIVTPPDWKIE